MKAEEKTRAFYEQEAKRYPRIHARPVQRYSAAFEAELMRPWLAAGITCLDVGCGEGRTARTLAGDASRRVVGLDFSVEMLRVAQVSAAGEQVLYCAGDAMQLPFPDGSFDLAVAVTSLNNVPDLAVSLREMGRVLKPGGRMLLLVINRLELAALFRAVYFLPFYLWRWLRGGKPYRSLTFSRGELVAALPASVRIVQLQGMRMLPDLLPEWPLNFHPVFAGGLTGLLRWLAPADRWLCRHPFFGRFARFHFLVAQRGADA